MIDLPLKFDAPILKSDGVRKQVSGLVYRPGVADSHGDYMTEATLTKSAHDALARGVMIDTNHSRRPTGAKLVESYVNAEGWNVVVQLTDQLWKDVQMGVYKAFSFGGRGQRVEKYLDGKKAREIVAAVIDSISLVQRGANQMEFIAKSDTASLVAAISELTALVKQNQTDLAALKGGPIAKSDDDIRRESASRAALEASELRLRKQALEASYFQLCEGAVPAYGQTRVQAERELLVEIDKCDRTLWALDEQARLSDSAVLAPSRSAFHQRGGRSQRLNAGRIFQGGDSAFEREADGLAKTAGTPLNSLKV